MIQCLCHVARKAELEQQLRRERLEEVATGTAPGHAGGAGAPGISQGAQLNHSGQYRCQGWLNTGESWQWQQLAPVIVTVHEIPILWVSVWAEPPGGQVAPGYLLVLSCEVATETRSLSFTWHWEGSGAPLGTSPHLELRHIGDNDSGHYHCRVSNGDTMAKSVSLNVSVLVAAGVVGSLSFLVLLMGIIVAFHWWHHTGG
ncbi:hypothetical protein HGM15179_021841 [Zosterops borbonicus]|uniref:Ig-like domain-containing protein n=1 Tax=Zosterops borbonicus TaxID=364589 RepID=A0A8K1D7I9_9PASS|nr:hypothetical protein HGM15179_021841 [Zosterops borbonicus]